MKIALRCAIAALAIGIAFAPVSPWAMSTDDAFSGPSADELYKKASKAVDLQRYREAIGDLEKVVKDKPKHADAFNLLGFSHRKLRELDVALSYYTKALAADPKHRGANEYLGEAYLELGKLPEAEARLQRLNELCGTDCKEYKELAQAVAKYKAGQRPPQSSRASW